MNKPIRHILDKNGATSQTHDIMKHILFRCSQLLLSRFVRRYNQKILFIALIVLAMTSLINAQCAEDYKWTTWINFTGTEATGSIDLNGNVIGVLVSANYPFSSSPSIFRHYTFDSFDATIPNSTVPNTDWSFGPGGQTSVCFSETVTNPVLLLASVGRPNVAVTLEFSEAYLSIFDGGGITFINDTALIGQEGYTVLVFPGEHDCVTIFSSTPEFYTNFTWGLNPPIFSIELEGDLLACDSSIITASGGLSYQWSGGSNPASATNSFYSSGQYFLTATDADDCAVVTSFSIQIENSTTSSISQIICPGQSFEGYSESGIFVDQFEAANGCDSVRQINLTVLPISSAELFIHICEGQQFENYDVTGVYIDTFTSSFGCDSIRTLNLTVSTFVSENITVSICEGEQFENYRASGIYTDTFASNSGCDSVRTLNLSVLSSITTDIIVSICPGEQFENYSESGVYVDTFTSNSGCDSIRTLNLTVVSSTSNTIAVSICEGESYDFHGMKISTQGTYVDTLTTSSGCDSVIQLDLEIVQNDFLGLDTIICGANSYLLVSPSPNTRWFDNTISQTKIILEPGEYWAIVKDVHGCELIDSISVQFNFNTYIPNAFSPNNDGINDCFLPYFSGEKFDNYKFNIFDRWGSSIFVSYDSSDCWNGEFKGKQCNPGVYVYYIEITSEFCGKHFIKGDITLVK